MKLPEWVRKLFCRGNSTDSVRVFHINDRSQNSEYDFPGNKIRTSKYTWYTFIPRGLFEQFRRVANMYFLFHAVTTFFPFTPVNPVTAIVPLCFVVGIAMLKELWEDIQRGRSDYETNRRKVDVLQPDGAFHTVRWRDIHVGDIVRVEADTFFPADLICLCSSLPNGSCHVETMNLDGETNLKLRTAMKETASLSTAELATLKGVVQCEEPNMSIYTFVGKMTLGGVAESEGAENQAHFLQPAQILLRGSKLRNTDWVIGVAVYTGVETKIMMNSTDPPSKRSFLERRMDGVILFQLLVLFLLCTGTAIGYGVTLARYGPSMWYWQPNNLGGITGFEAAAFNYNNPWLAGTMQWFTAKILYGYFVPISLYISVELVRLIQARFINWDQHLYYEDKKIPMSVRTSNLNDELGMITTVLSDKTGTLTRNQMEFFKCSIAGVSYGMGATEVEKAAAELGRRPMPEFIEEEDEDDVYVPEKPLERGFNMKDPRLDSMKWVDLPGEEVAPIRRFLEVLSLCQTVVVSTTTGASMGGSMRGGKSSRSWTGSFSKEGNMSGRVTNGSTGGSNKEGNTSGRGANGSTGGSARSGPVEPDPDTIQYMAESPDEAAFVTAAKRFGYFFYGRDGDKVLIREFGPGWKMVGDVQYQLLNTMAFTSHRKRMSVVVRDPQGKLLLLTKGADSVIIARLANTREAQRWRAETESHMTTFAEAGLRTLAVAYKELDEQEYATWQGKWLAAQSEVGSASAQAEKLESLAEELERDFILLGATAIEDKLQVGVPQTIEKLWKAGIKVWVLTGDKLETAINIGYACNLLRHEMKQHLIFLEDNEAVEKQARDLGTPLEQFSLELVKRQVQEAYDAVALKFSGGQAHGLIVDGKSLEVIMDNEDIKHKFLKAALGCDSVICCRTSPKQKADVTELVRRKGGQKCLAVGDGANDVGMIQKANVGVGIAGEEGQQAVMASDFAIGQFRFLERLLLVHGAWCYRRMAFLICYFLYKSITFALTVVLYNCTFSLFSGAPLYNDWFLSLFQVLFSSLPVTTVAIMDQDVKAVYRLRYPGLYVEGQKNQLLTWSRFYGYVFAALYQASVMFCMVVLPNSIPSPMSKGLIWNALPVGTILCTCVVLVVNFELLFTVQYLTWINHLMTWFTVGMWFVFLICGSFLPYKWTGPLNGNLQSLIRVPAFYLIVVVTVVAALLPTNTVKALYRNLSPTDSDIVQEIAKQESKKRRQLQGGSTLSYVMSAIVPSTLSARWSKSDLQGMQPNGSSNSIGQESINSQPKEQL